MKIALVGGLPEPIGGVTSFISRLAGNNLIDLVVDFYPSERKVMPSKFTGKIVYVKNIIKLIFYFWSTVFSWEKWLGHFNFFTEKSLLFFLFIPKVKVDYVLMLHHGDLNAGRLSFLYKMALARLDFVYCLSDKQKVFYESLGVSPDKLIRTSSFVPPLIDVENKNSKIYKSIDNFFENKNVLTCSGYPADIYNHDWCINFIREQPQFKLALFLYGTGDLSKHFKEIEDNYVNIKIFWSTEESAFNYALSKSLIYLRPTSKDSFGIAVADAASFGIKVLASDVCERYPGVNLFTPINYETFKLSLLALLNDQKLPVQKQLNFKKFNYNYFNGTK